MPYHTACGPRAVAAVSGVDVATAAAQLTSIARKRGVVCIPATDATVLETWFALWGFVVEQWNVYTDRPHASPAECRELLLAAEPPFVDGRSVVERVAAAHPEFPRELIEDQMDEIQSKLSPLADWIGAHPQGTWLCYTADHVLAFHDGRVLAGDHTDLRQYGRERVIGATRLSRPPEG